MKTYLSIILILICGLEIFGQIKTPTPTPSPTKSPEYVYVPIMTLRGEQLVTPKGWKSAEVFFDSKGDKAEIAYSFQTDTIVETGASTYKVWGKIEDFADKTIRHSLVLFEVKCGKRESRLLRIIKVKFKESSEDLPNPNPLFEDIPPDSLLEIFYTPVCKQMAVK